MDSFYVFFDQIWLVLLGCVSIIMAEVYLVILN